MKKVKNEKENTMTIEMPHASDCSFWSDESCDCVASKDIKADMNHGKCGFCGTEWTTVEVVENCPRLGCEGVR